MLDRAGGPHSRATCWKRGHLAGLQASGYDRVMGAAIADHLQGAAALSSGDWQIAREAFERDLRREESAVALEGLGWAAWWLEDAEAVFRARERAYLLYREAGDCCGAARVAVWLALDHLTFRGEPAVASGWLQRAERLLAAVPLCSERGWLSLYQGHVALMIHKDTRAAKALGARAAEIGRELTDVDLEMVGLALEGLALVSEGAIGEGMPRLDEATTAAVAGELNDRIAIFTSCCYLIYACERVRDYGRAAQWCERVREFTERWKMRHAFALCRTHYAGLLIHAGAWDEAEAELGLASRELAATRPPILVNAVVRLAELRRRQGDPVEARGLLEPIVAFPPALVGLAAVALDEGDHEAAAELAARYLRQVPREDRTERADALEVRALALAGAGQAEEAARCGEELLEVAQVVGSQSLRAIADRVRGRLAATIGDLPTARDALADAADGFERAGGTFDSAVTRLDLAEVLRDLDRRAAATRAAARALEALTTLRARAQASRAENLLAQLRDAAAQPSQTRLLSRREQEVLRLVAEGLSNRAIADRLVLSEHTVRRHVQNVLAKLGVGSRTAAASRALRDGLL